MTNLIRRDDLTQLISEWKSGGLESVTNLQKGRRDIVRLRNDGATLTVGLPVTITGRMFPSVSADDALREYLNYGVQLAGQAPAEEIADAITAITAEPIVSGRVGRVYLPGCVGATISRTNSTDAFVTAGASGFISGSSGPYRIVAESNGFAFLIPSSGSGGGGHYVGETTSAVMQGSLRADMVSVTLSDGTEILAHSPLTRPGVLIPAAAKVIISKNIHTDDFEIIAIECPEE